MSDNARIDELCINTIRFLSADAVQKANSGHPGAPMGMAPTAFALWDRFLKHNPRNPQWADRDRFVLSAGHASMLVYSLLHLTGYDLSLDEIRNFRQWGSKTPGHPEHGETPGVEITTGPLGQGMAHAVGMAMAERRLAALFNREGHEVVDHFTYALVSDGDMQEGVTSEAASIAGTLGLGKLVCLYDDNGIQIEGSTSLTFTEDVGARFKAYGWQVIGPVDGHSVEAVAAALKRAKRDRERPSLIICKTVIGFGSPNEGKSKVHGEPLGEENVRAAKEKLGWPLEPLFLVPDEAAAHLGAAVARGAKAETAWSRKFKKYEKEFPELAAKFRGQMSGELPEGWDAGLESLFPPETPPMETRVASGKALNALAKRVDALFGGSADLAPSNKTLIDGCEDFKRPLHDGRNIRFGVREHAMGAIAGGMALHGGIIPYTGTFLQFADYMRPPMRLAALMKQRVVYVFTHDSIGLGEDGPTHQPVEHIMCLRAIPNLTVIRPADASETAEAWRAAALNTEGPTAIILTRQKLTPPDRTKCAPADRLHRGGYILWESAPGIPEAIIIATGSEVEIALKAAEALAAGGVRIRVVAMPCWEFFDAQPAVYREEVLPSAVRARVAVEAGLSQGWEKYVGLDGGIVGIDRFGASAPIKTLYEKFGITAEAVAAKVKTALG